MDDRPRRARYADAASARATERIPYEAAFGNAGSFAELTYQAVLLAEEVGEPYAGVLRLLSDCYEATGADAVPYRQQHQGATYKQLAAIAYRAGMSREQRMGWYRISERLPLSQRHAGHILDKLQQWAAA